MNESGLRRVSWLFAFSVLFAGTAPAQCAASWLPGDGLAGADRVVRAAVRWDPDGAGPQPEVVVIGGDFALVGDVLANHIATWDPQSGAFGALGAGIGGVVYALASLPNGELVAGGEFTTAGGVACSNIARWNGTQWQPLGAGTNLKVLALAVLPSGDLVAGGAFPFAGGIAVGGVGVWDGSQWSSIGAAADYWVEALAVAANGDLLVGGAFHSIGGIAADEIARWDGAQWHALGTGTNGGIWRGVEAVAELPNGDVVVGGTFATAGGATANRIARWDGAQWHAIAPAGNILGEVFALAVLPNGDLLAGAYYDIFTQFRGIARWDGSTWSPLGTGTNGPAQTILPLPSGDVVVGGTITAAGGVAASYAARYDGTTWYPLSAGGATVDGAISGACATANGDLVVAGDFEHLRGIAAHFVARRHGATWSAVGSGPTGVPKTVVELANGDLVVAGTTVERWDGTAWQAIPPLNQLRVDALLALPNGDLVAGGYRYLNVWPGTYQYYPEVQRFDGTAWQVIGASQTYSVFPYGVAALARLPNGDLVAGGSFTELGGVQAAISRFDGTAWHALGSGVAGSVAALATLANGDLAVGGAFLFPGITGNVQRWDGTAWHPYGAGFSGAPDRVNALQELPDGDLVAAGVLTVSGATTLHNIARFDGTAWQAVDIGLSGSGVPTAMAFLPTGELAAVGSFTIAGAFVAAHLALLQTPCAALAAPVPTTCVGPQGPLVLTAEAPPWLGATFRANATGFAPQALGVALLGFGSPGVSLAYLHPSALPGCDQLADGLAIRLTLPIAGQSTFTWSLPNTTAYAGIAVYHQFLQFELGAQNAIVSLSSSNALRLTLGAF